MYSRPKTWMGIIRSRSGFATLVNNAMAMMMRSGLGPSKRQVCETLGLDYDDAEDREKVTQAIRENRESGYYAWNLWIESADFDATYQRVADDSAGFLGWKTQKAALIEMMKQLGMEESDIHQLWIMSQLWERFLVASNQWNIHIFVAFGTPWHRDGFKYRQPNFWDYTANQVETARRLCKGTITILERHRDMGMILTSGAEVQMVIETARDTLQMIADGSPPKYKCELCAAQGIMSVFKTQAELVEHYKTDHTA
jgi:hypothetical protein